MVQETGKIKSDYAESYLKPISDSMDTALLTKTSENLTKQVTLVLESFKKDLDALKPILGKYKTYRRYARFPADFKDQCERICFMLAKPDETDEYQHSKGSMRAWLVDRLMMKTQFIVLFSKMLLEEIQKIPKHTGKQYQFTKDTDLRITEFRDLSIFDEIDQMIGVLNNSIDEYIAIKANLFQLLGLLESYRPPQIFPTHWEFELTRTHIDIIKGDDSAIYHVRTALELMLQITLAYFDDPILAKHARLVTTRRVAEACKKVGIDLPISQDLTERISYYSNLSLHRGQRIPLSDVWHMLSVLVEVSERMKKLQISKSQLSALKQELISGLQLRG